MAPPLRRPPSVSVVALAILAPPPPTFVVRAAPSPPLLSHLAPLASMTEPGRFHFLEFPPPSDYSTDSTSDPSSVAACGDGTPFSFAFKRGTDENLNRVAVEFGNGAACWDGETCGRVLDLADAAAADGGGGGGGGGGGAANPLQVPWHDGARARAAFGGAPLGSCSGLPASFVRRAAPVLFGDDALSSANGTEASLPLPLGAREGTTTDRSAGLGNLGSQVSDSWSYIYVPHCTADLHLGARFRTASYGNGWMLHRGGFNALAVLDWIVRNFPELDALVATGCGAGATAIPAVFAAAAAEAYREGRGRRPIRRAYALSDGPINPVGLAMAEAEVGRGPLEAWEPWRILGRIGGGDAEEEEDAAADVLGGAESGSAAERYLISALVPLVHNNPEVRFGYYGLYNRTLAGGGGALSSLPSSFSAADEGRAADAYDAWLRRMSFAFPRGFFGASVPGGTACRFALDGYGGGGGGGGGGGAEGGAERSDASSGYADWTTALNSAEGRVRYADWIGGVTSNWEEGGGGGGVPSSSAAAAAASSGTTAADGGFRPTFLFVLAATFLSLTAVWAGWHAAMWARSRRLCPRRRRRSPGGVDDDGGDDADDDDGADSGGKAPRCRSPLDLWLLVLTRYPASFLLISLAVPCIVSYLGFEASDRAIDINLDFDTYLEIDTAEAAFDADLGAARAAQAGTVEEFFEGDCKVLKDPPAAANVTATGKRRDLRERLSVANGVVGGGDGRSLQKKFPGKGERLDIFFLSPEWRPDRPADVFTAPALTDAHSLEERIRARPGWGGSCYQHPRGQGECAPFESVIGRFFDEEGRITDDIEAELLEMIEDGAVGWTDRYLSVVNLGSNFTRTTMYLRKNASGAFFQDLHRDVLWPADRNGEYPNVVFSWTGSPAVAQLEAHEALRHDAYWAVGTVLVVSILVLLKIRNPFVFLAAMAGLILSFPAAYYWYYVHFEITEIKIIQASALFVMLGIGADDIFLMADAYAHTLVYLGPDAEPGMRMGEAYRRAGSTMLVTTVTAAVCFYSNAFSVMLIVREFGLFMGTVILLNFVHVMTILPSAMLVSDLYLAPLWRRIKARIVGWWRGGRSRLRSSRAKERLESSERREEEGRGNKYEELSEFSDEDMRRSLPERDGPPPPDRRPEDDDDDGAGGRSSTATPAPKGPDRDKDEAGDERDIAETHRPTGSESSGSGPSSSDDGGGGDDDDDVETGVPTGDLAKEREEGRERDDPVARGKRGEGREWDDPIVDVDRMNRFDRWLFTRYAPFIYRRRWIVIVASVAVAATLGVLAYSNFAISDQGIVLFRDEYNLGRVATIKNAYFPRFSQFKTDEDTSGLYADALKERLSGGNETAPSSPSSSSSSSAAPTAAAATSAPTRAPSSSSTPPPTEAPTASLVGPSAAPSSARRSSGAPSPAPSSPAPSRSPTSPPGAAAPSAAAPGADPAPTTTDGTAPAPRPTAPRAPTTDDAPPAARPTPAAAPRPAPTSPSAEAPTTTDGGAAGGGGPTSPPRRPSSGPPRPTPEPAAADAATPPPRSAAPAQSGEPAAPPSEASTGDGGGAPSGPPGGESGGGGDGGGDGGGESGENDGSRGESGASSPRPNRRPTPPPRPKPTAAPVPPPTTPAPVLRTCPRPCRNGGTCDAATLTCRCQNGWGGETCEAPACPAAPEGYDCTAEGECTPIMTPCSGRGQCQPIDAEDAGRGEWCVCDGDYYGADCSNELPTIFQLKETFEVKIVWGIERRERSFADLWDRNAHRSSSGGGVRVDGGGGSNASSAAAGFGGVPFRGGSFDPSAPEVQAWIWEVCRAAREPSSGLNVRSDLKTWIEIIQEEAEENGVRFPLPGDMFAGYVSLLMENSRSFRRRYRDEIGTSGPGFGRDLLYVSVTMLAEVPVASDDDGSRAAALRRWEDFVSAVNRDAPAKAGPAVVQSDAFQEAHREDAILSTTISTWAIANGVCLVIILLFTRNVALSLIVMVTIILLAVCLMGFILAVLAIDFGPIEAIGVTIFVGLSANYALHIAHAYHNNSARSRLEKVRLTVFATASPIAASAVSTIGACAFLLGCRLWLFVELGVMLCTNTGMALIFSMFFLLAVLSVVGPLPYEGEDRRLHQCDFRALLSGACCRRRREGDVEAPVGKEVDDPALDTPSEADDDDAGFPLRPSDRPDGKGGVESDPTEDDRVIASESGAPQCGHPDDYADHIYDADEA